MKKFITDIHTHSAYSYDCEIELKEMLARAQSLGIDFYGVSEHVDYDVVCRYGANARDTLDASEYFHGARHLQEDYAGVMNVLVGVECSYGRDPRVSACNRALIEKYAPDFVVNSVHAVEGDDYYDRDCFYKNGVLRDQKEVYDEYFGLVLESLDCDYPYDIVGHIGYAMRYAPYADKTIRYEDYADKLDAILCKIIEKGKILEVNASRGIASLSPSDEILKRYFALGGRRVSYASDSHSTAKICRDRDEVTAYLQTLGFTHITVPCKGEYIKVEL